MPLVQIKIIEDVFSRAQKQEMIKKVTDAMVSVEGESLRSVTWVVIDDLANRFQLSGAIPTSILYDPMGQVKQQFVGKLEQPQFTALENFVR